MEWIKPGSNFDFMKASRFWVPFSVGLTVASVALVAVKGFDSGIDFKGGTKVIAEFKRDAGVERGAIKGVVDDLVAKQTGITGTQVEVQDFDVGAAANADTVKYQVFTELPSLLTPLKKLEISKEVEKHFGKGCTVEIPHEAGDKFYVNLPEDWPLAAARAEIAKVFAAAGHGHVSAVSDKEERILSDVTREKDLLLTARDEMVKAEAQKVEDEANRKIGALTDSRFTVEVQAIKDQVTDSLKTRFGAGFVDVLSTASVSPSVGKELFQTGMLAMLYAIIGILIYIALRYDMKFAPGAVACLIHDVAVVFGVMSLLDIKFTLPIVAAILTIIGYDINDTVIVYDRIRENMQKGKGGDLARIINISINETLSRTIMTSLLTELTLVSIWLLGGGTIKDFAFTVFVGIILGTYSSIFVASPLTLYLEKAFKGRPLARA
jgi:preprotein translocase SecF subunit